ncbi:hypothetical protein DNTS_013743 [Danionella cerebrum]|uniref:Uncharacterized protein n=1 Tax=Danionella cerebrum TaxID=2873325 RepID=A0A553R236_9TELE|nr:hypothetical protein DNTS_013743 [Danionella translucida]
MYSLMDNNLGRTLRMNMVDQSALQSHLDTIQSIAEVIVERVKLGDKNNGFDVLYHNMKHGQISSKELSDFIRERATIEEAYSRSMTKLAKTASNFSQLGTFAPMWDVFKQSTEKLATCHMELVRKLQELIKEVQKYVDEQAKNHKKALQKSKEIYISKTLEHERMRKEGATQRELDKAGLKVKKATESYKSFVEKYASAKSEFEQKMTETAQKFQAIEEEHILRMQEIIHSYSQSVEETHVQIGEVQQEFVNNMENTSIESLIQKLAESKGTGKERPGPIEFEECNVSVATEGRRKDKDTDSTESTEVETNTSNGAPPGFYGAIDLHNANVPQLDEEGFCIRPEVNENDILHRTRFYLAFRNTFSFLLHHTRSTCVIAVCGLENIDSEDEDEPRKFHVQIKPVQSNNGTHQHKATIDELKASIGNITLSPTPAVHMKRNQSNDELTRTKIAHPPLNDKFTSNDLLSLDPFGPTNTSSIPGSSLSQSSEADVQSEPTSPSAVSLEVTETPAFPLSSNLSPPARLTKPSTAPFPALPLPPSTSPWELRPGPVRALSIPPTLQAAPKDYTTQKPPLSAPAAGSDMLSSWAQRQWIAFNEDVVPWQGASQQPARPRSVPVSHQARLFSGETTDPFGSIGVQESFHFLKDRVMVKDMQDANLSLCLFLQCTVPPSNRPTTPLGTASIVPPPRPLSRPKLPTGKLTGINESGRPFSPPKLSNSSPPPATAPLARAESSSSLSSNASLSASNTPTVGTSRGPSPVTLASQDALPIAVAFTESVNAYFKGADPSMCIVKITGDMTLSFPSGIIKIFTSSPSPAVLSFKLANTSRLEQIMPNQQLLHSDSSQSDTNTKDFWLNMPALTSYLKKSSEQNPAASYYNVDILKYQVCSNGIQSTPLNLVVYWKCSHNTTDLRVDYRYNPEAMQPPVALTNIQVLVPVNGGVTNMQSLPSAIWNAEQNKSLWKLSDISDKSENEGSGSLRAKFELSEGPSIPATLAVQFFSEGSTLSGVDMELAGSGYRLSLNKKRFATGRYMADC